MARQGEVRRVPVRSAPGSVPIARGTTAARKMAAPSAADSHVSRRHRRTPPPPLAEPDPESGSASGGLSVAEVLRGPAREGAAAKGQSARRRPPPRVRGFRSRNRGRPSFGRPRTRSGYWACALLSRGSPLSGFSLQL